MKILRLFIIILLLYSPAISQASILAGPVTNPENGHVYYLLTTNTWTASEAEAVGLGGHLSTINDALEEAWVLDTFGMFGAIPRSLWIGLTDQREEEVFTWINGEASGYRDWASGEPNNANGNEDYVYIIDPANPTKAGKWNDVPDNSVTAIQGVVETDPAQVTTGCCLPPPGLVSWWRGEGDARDFAGTNNGTLLNGAAFAPGKVGWAFSLDGVHDYVDVPDSSNLRLTTQFTIEAWINPRTTSSDQDIVSKVGGAAGNNGYELVLTRDNSLVGMFNSPGQSWPTAKIAFSNADAFAPGVWSHVAWTYDQATMKLYVNGVLMVTSAIGQKSIITANNNLRIGGNDNNMNYFNGLIDEASVYNRALTSSEISALYTAGSAGKCRLPRISVQPQSQIGYWSRSVTLTVTADSTEPLDYQWYKDGSLISGAKSASMLLTNLQADSAGIYTVVATNVYGSITSNPAILTITPAAVDIAMYAGVAIDGVIGNIYGIQFSTDLSGPNFWQGLTNITLKTQTFLWYDSQPAIQPRRYYRVVPGPISIP